ncbi:SOS response-associated peptidase family protein [Porticoccaceae bacterium LTM1]|nr:SOS response-associated peptidase family protein [Porticoccaceae bacterium LTM1]
MADRLGIDDRKLCYSPDIRPGHIISIVVERGGQRQVLDAIWWLYLQQTERGMKVNPDYFSVNTNYAKLPQKPEYRHSRCIIMASSFVESQQGKKPHELRPADGSAIAFGGLWKAWHDKATEQTVYSASIITLPGLPALAEIHKKAFPLWLPDDAYDPWLDANVTDTACFDDLLIPHLRAPLEAVQVDRASSKKPVGSTRVIKE